MSKLYFLFYLSVFFPYFAIFPGMYNQPTSLFLSILILLINPKIGLLNLKPIFLVAVIIFSLSGVLIGFSDIGTSYLVWAKHLYTYVSFPIILIVFLNGVRENRLSIITLLEVSVLIWGIVGVIQFFILPNFMVGLTSGVADGMDLLGSGRGVLSLAPEPTHYAFHMIILSSCLFMLGGNKKVVYLGMAQVIFPSLSSGGLFVLALAVLVCLIAFKIRLLYIILFTIFGFLVLMLLLTIDFDTRFFSLFSKVIVSPELVLEDYSVNMRIVGLYSSFIYILESFFIPFGLSSDSWALSSSEILNKNDFLFDLSKQGVPSGIGIILYEVGIFALPLIIYILSLIFLQKRRNLDAIITTSGFCVIFMQYTLASAPAVAYLAVLYLTYNDVLNGKSYE